ncbi:MAG: hypothetical protein CM15mP120_14190 [Pseudomonadota bacterium]|nr:MAG: hypothetical protein CM15mP120_14190 [Pseudomonadota bacterium]
MRANVSTFNSCKPIPSDCKPDTERLQASTERQLAKITTQLAATDAQLAATDAQLQANAVQQAQTEAKLNRTAEKIDRLAEMYGGVSNSQGAVAEEFYYNSLKDKPVLIGMNFDSIYKNIAGNRHGVEDEFDLVLVNRDNVFVLEIKYKAHPRDLRGCWRKSEATSIRCFRSIRTIPSTGAWLPFICPTRLSMPRWRKASTYCNARVTSFKR